jgi:UrcA family protein
MHGALAVFMLIPRRICGPTEDRTLKAKFHSATRSISLRVALATIVCGVVFTTAATASQRDGGALTKVVSYADLNLNGAAGARTLYGRLRMAATQVCAPFMGTTLRDKTNWRECFEPALARSIAEIDEPMLTSYHLSQTGKTESLSRVAKDQ